MFSGEIKQMYLQFISKEIIEIKKGAVNKQTKKLLLIQKESFLVGRDCWPEKLSTLTVKI